MIHQPPPPPIHGHCHHPAFSVSCLLQERAVYLAVWIDIAQELRLLKNFSSLKAIITGLNSSAIYRLRKIWSVLPKEKVFYLLSFNSNNNNNLSSNH